MINYIVSQARVTGGEGELAPLVSSSTFRKDLKNSRDIDDSSSVPDLIDSIKVRRRLQATDAAFSEYSEEF